VIESTTRRVQYVHECQQSKLIVPGRSVIVRRPVDESIWKKRNADTAFNRHGISDGTRPLLFTWEGGAIEAQHRQLPFADASLDRVEIEDTLELIRNDRKFYEELARVIAPGGLLRARVPNTGLMAGFDSFNLYKYLTDITKRGVRLPETEEIAFRRHLSLRELDGALGEAFAIERSWTTGTALSEVANLLALTAFTWRQERPNGYLKLQPTLRRLIRFDAKAPIPGVGFWLHIEARRV
jgi:SAM-dependent methyltransferase